ncbi:hypothetical protein JMJ35_009331 [Cladonia borealis]|uniref:Apc15p protein-domain-containing protein n=1 Tax=Cladonia borealis TaxID=184061 RepID=A0AA39QS77_9LECA|nr:hypothetical protein JMJ35_009331 [Cladonia borealis]
MFSSLPPLFPHDPHTLWYPSLSTHPRPRSPSTSDTPLNPHSPTHQHRNINNPSQNPQRTLLSILRADENQIAQRKQNIRRFGAGWLRPPGVAKTLQGMDDEKAEREEVESARAREFALAEAQQAAEAANLGTLPPSDAAEPPRDLDDSIPDLDAAAWSDADMTEDEEGLGEEEEGEHEGVLDPTDDAGDVIDFIADEGNVDLDELIPEADMVGGGEYEHTDTEVEDVSSSDEEEVGVGGGQQGRRGPVVGTFRQGVQGVVQRVGGLGSSVFGSSPVRESLGGRGRRRSGRGRGGREN